jgi:hypothetical protein
MTERLWYFFLYQSQPPRPKITTKRGTTMPTAIPVAEEDELSFG